MRRLRRRRWRQRLPSPRERFGCLHQVPDTPAGLGVCVPGVGGQDAGKDAGQNKDLRAIETVAAIVSREMGKSYPAALEAAQP